MFKQNETVFYHNNGICEIIDICDKSIANQTKTYYVLKPLHDNRAIIYVPCDNQQLVMQMKKILSKKEVEDIISKLPSQASVWVEDRHQRKEKFQDILHNGNCLEIATMLKSIHLKRIQLAESKKKLPSADDAIYRDAQKMLVETFAYILDMKKKDIIPYILSHEKNN